MDDVETEVSIHAPVRERLGLFYAGEGISGFNPRPRKGATVPSLLWLSLIAVSIHAPVRERRQTRYSNSSM